MQTGSRVRVPGHGNAGTHGSPPGDLYFIIEVKAHQYFQRRGDDLCTAVPITVSEAALGAKIEVPTLDGRSLLRVPRERAAAARSFGCAKKVCHSVRQPGKTQGVICTWSCKSLCPSQCDERVRDLLRELARLEPENPRQDLFARAGVGV